MSPISDPVYLDGNASTPVHPAVLEAMLPFLREHFGNPSSEHAFGRRARAAVDTARAQVADLIGCDPDEITFTSGGTEANNLAIRGAMAASTRRRLVTSTVEHPATSRPCALLAADGVEVVRLPVDVMGSILTATAEAVLGAGAGLLTVMLAQNEVGTILPLAQRVALGAVRLSLGRFTTRDHVQTATAALGRAFTEVRDRGPVDEAGPQR